MKKRLRELAVACVVFSAIVGLIAVYVMALELVQGQAHGPSALVVGPMMLLVAGVVGWIGWRLL
jgi:hypothetical protein